MSVRSGCNGVGVGPLRIGNMKKAWLDLKLAARESARDPVHSLREPI
jgi:hypothetical protein